MKKLAHYFILLFGIFIFVFFLIIPLIQSIFPTFLPVNGGFENYSQFFKDDFYRGIFIRTLRISAIVTVLCFVLGLPTAYFVAGLSKSKKSLLMAAILFPLLTNSVIRSFAWINILGRNGVINNFLLQIGLINQPLTMLYTEFSIIVGSIYLFLPTMILTLVGVLETIEGEIFEAAQTLGASSFTVFRKIILPLSIPGAIVGSILVFTGTLTAYTTPQLLGGNQRMMMATFLYQRATTLGDWNSASVIALILIISTVIVMKLMDLFAAKLDKRGALNA
ncbi:MAG: ABC transporter permease [Streptococcaceae bacterium]|jgi:putative spermidine/putrescine transport system permease protein|nr:ABC transporter permease [Streptococcaceae bacterium]